MTSRAADRRQAAFVAARAENNNHRPMTLTQLRGTDDQEFQIFLACAEDLGWPLKTFEEWKAS